MKLGIYLGGLLLEVVGGMLFRLIFIVNESMNGSPESINGARILMGSFLGGLISMFHYGAIALFTFGFTLTIYGAIVNSQRR